MDKYSMVTSHSDSNLFASTGMFRVTEKNGQN